MPKWRHNGDDENDGFKLYVKMNAQDDVNGPPKKLRVVVVTVKHAYEEKTCSKMPGGISEGPDYFTVPLKHGPKYAMLVAGR